MLNKVMLIGHLGGDPEIRYTPTSGTPVARFSIATNERYKKGEEQIEHTEWHRIAAWGKLAEFCSQYLSKGRQVYIEGRLRTRSWEDQNGSKHYITEVLAGRIRLLDKKPQIEPQEEIPAGDIPVPSEEEPVEDTPF